MEHSEELTITQLLKHNAGFPASLLSVFITGDTFLRSQELFWGLWDFISEYLLTLSLHIMHVCTHAHVWEEAQCVRRSAPFHHRRRFSRYVFVDWLMWVWYSSACSGRAACFFNLDHGSPQYQLETCRCSAQLSYEHWTKTQFDPAVFQWLHSGFHMFDLAWLISREVELNIRFVLSVT